jgi:ribosomal protein S27AE
MKKNLIEIYNRAKEIVESKELSWLDKNEKIFSYDISVQTINSFDWYDPDTDHRDDVKAFMYAFENYMINENLICPECRHTYIYDIGYDNYQCGKCENVFKHKSKTGLEYSNNI